MINLLVCVCMYVLTSMYAYTCMQNMFIYMCHLNGVEAQSGCLNDL